MKTICFILSVAASISLCRAQDIITKTDSSRVHAQIVEITPSELRYKLLSYPDGPLITIYKTEVAYATFKNGLVERFPKPAPPVAIYNPNRYNLDKVPVDPYDPGRRAKKTEVLYKHKNYIGFNYITFINSALGFHYMRDVKKAHLVINVPVAFGVGSPAITNGLYGRSYLDNTSTTRYTRMNYQLGVNVLFAPGMSKEVNFLMGPSFNFTEYRMNVATSHYVRSQNQDIGFNNSFKLYRAHYGVNIGFLARYAEHFNMSMLITFGFKQDSYSEKDPYGIEAFKTNYNLVVQQPDNVMPYVNFAWSLGYRF